MIKTNLFISILALIIAIIALITTIRFTSDYAQINQVFMTHSHKDFEMIVEVLKSHKQEIDKLKLGVKWTKIKNQKK